MGNMSYCRFQNTVLDVRDCRGALAELLDEGMDPLSAEELQAARQLVGLCAEVLQTVGEAMGLDAGEVADLCEQRVDTVMAVLETANEAAGRRAGEGEEEEVES